MEARRRYMNGYPVFRVPPHMTKTEAWDAFSEIVREEKRLEDLHGLLLDDRLFVYTPLGWFLTKVVADEEDGMRAEDEWAVHRLAYDEDDGCWVCRSGKLR